MPGKKLSSFLDEQEIKYVAIRHSPRFTAQEIAASAHVPGKELAKTVVVKLEEELALAVLPASYRVDFERKATALGLTLPEACDAQACPFDSNPAGTICCEEEQEWDTNEGCIDL